MNSFVSAEFSSLNVSNSACLLSLFSMFRGGNTCAENLKGQLFFIFQFRFIRISFKLITVLFPCENDREEFWSISYLKGHSYNSCDAQFSVKPALYGKTVRSATQKGSRFFQKNSQQWGNHDPKNNKTGFGKCSFRLIIDSTGAGESTLSIFSNFWHTNLLQGPILLWTFVNWKTASFRFGLDDQLDRALIAEVISSNNTFSPVILYETLTHFVKKVCFVNHLFWINHRATI